MVYTLLGGHDLTIVIAVKDFVDFQDVMLIWTKFKNVSELDSCVSVCYRIATTADAARPYI